MIPLATAEKIAGREWQKRIAESAFWSSHEIKTPVLSRETEEFWLFSARKV